VNPEYLSVGTQLENQQDKWRKGRGNNPRGQNHASSKISDAQAEDIRNSAASGKEPQHAIADRFGISQTQVSRILRMERRQHGATAVALPEKRFCDKLTASQREEIIRLCTEGVLLHRQIGEMFGVTRGNISYLWTIHRKKNGLKRSRTHLYL